MTELAAAARHPPLPGSSSSLWLGAQPTSLGTYFSVWAPRAHQVEVMVEGQGSIGLLKRDRLGYYTGVFQQIKAGDRYQYRIDGEKSYPDPCSRFQPDGPHGPSLIVDPAHFEWNDSHWLGLSPRGQILYELHVGTFTRAGTFDGAAQQLPELKRLGITAVEMMPVAECDGRWNWGYDGVCLYAPSHYYGDAEALKRFVDAAHRMGIGVILDVVYNHLGPCGNYLSAFSPDYFTRRYQTDWGEAIHFEGPQPVREHFLQNAAYWISEFHLDGLRLDATQNIYDNGPRHILSEITERARGAAGHKTILIIGENEPQDVRCVRPFHEKGFGFDAVWNDDFHHTAQVAATGFREAYYTDYLGRPQEFISQYKRGFLFQGQHYRWQKAPRGARVTNEPASAFVVFLQNHDQVANSGTGKRLHMLTTPALHRTLTALLLLAPETPMLFMGQEFAASNPFLFFSDFKSPLSDDVYSGRKKFLSQFPSYARTSVQRSIPYPNDRRTFKRCVLDFRERKKHAAVYQLHKDLIHLRQNDDVLQKQDRFAIDGAVMGPDTFVIRYSHDIEGDRLLVIHLGKRFKLDVQPEPLIASQKPWQLKWFSEAKIYGGNGRKLIPERPWYFERPAAYFYAAEA